MTGWDWFALIGAGVFTFGALCALIGEGWRFRGVWICTAIVLGLVGLVVGT